VIGNFRALICTNVKLVWYRALDSECYSAMALLLVSKALEGFYSSVGLMFIFSYFWHADCIFS